MESLFTAKLLYMFRVSLLGHAGGRLLIWQYDMYQKLQLEFDVLLMMSAIDTRNM